ncbi:helix-turn-helix domain-containing protein [Gordonia westfalica]|uniref:Helix-turn-helix domain-containing protein n=1 Tax=Gordonia westfalica TaxID=158898 RepID=A0ABU2H0K5_9ACTN|nr:helix-turn-helix domain-containing protein [Gordonia westfalica]MDS1116730.1 helix-turn-helix domain-containing protein [Gordonia westfalica]
MELVLITLASVLAFPPLELDQLTPAAQNGTAVERVLLARRAEDLRSVEQSIVVLMEPGARLRSYEFDVDIRVAAARGALAVVIADPDAPKPSATSLRAAERHGIAVLRNRARINVAELVCLLDLARRGGAERALSNVSSALDVLRMGSGGDAGHLVASVGRSLGVEMMLTEAPDDAVMSFRIDREAEGKEWVAIKPSAAEYAPGLLASLGRLTAAAIELDRITGRRASELPIRSRAEVLSELLDSSKSGRSDLLRRARALGLYVDGWHIAARVEVPDPEDEGELKAFTVREELSESILEHLTSSGTWHMARSEGALLFVKMHRHDPGGEAGPAAVRAVQKALESLPNSAAVFCGVGSIHSGPTGLISSAAEARAAAAAMRTRRRPNHAAAFDNLGLRRTVIEWYASQAARNAVDSVLAPLDELGPGKAPSAIRTLQAYLDNHGSLSRTAEDLHLHRNSVAYRIERIFAALEVEPDNPDDWLLLQLACRARTFA